VICASHCLYHPSRSAEMYQRGDWTDHTYRVSRPVCLVHRVPLSSHPIRPISPRWIALRAHPRK
jgi:hypothetical protein